MTTQAENQARVAQYESFYAGTRYYNPATGTMQSEAQIKATPSPTTGMSYPVIIPAEQPKPAEVPAQPKIPELEYLRSGGMRQYNPFTKSYEPTESGKRLQAEGVSITPSHAARLGFITSEQARKSEIAGINYAVAASSIEARKQYNVAAYNQEMYNKKINEIIGTRPDITFMYALRSPTENIGRLLAGAWRGKSVQQVSYEIISERMKAETREQSALGAALGVAELPTYYFLGKAYASAAIPSGIKAFISGAGGVLTYREAIGIAKEPTAEKISVFGVRTAAALGLGYLGARSEIKPDIKPIETKELSANIAELQRVRKGGYEFYLQKGEVIVTGKNEFSLYNLQRFGKMGKAAPSEFFGTSVKYISPEQIEIRSVYGLEQPLWTAIRGEKAAAEGFTYFAALGKNIKTGWTYGKGVSKLLEMASIEIPEQRTTEMSKIIFGLTKGEGLTATKAIYGQAGMSLKTEFAFTKGNINVASIGKPLTVGGGGRAAITEYAGNVPSLMVGGEGELWPDLAGALTASWAKAAGATTLSTGGFAGWQPKEKTTAEETVYIMPEIAREFGAKETGGLSLRAQLKTRLQTQTQLQTQLGLQTQTQQQTQLRTQLQTQQQLQTQTQQQTQLRTQLQLGQLLGTSFQFRTSTGIALITSPTLKKYALTKSFKIEQRKREPKSTTRTIRIKSTPLSDILSVTTTQARLLSSGKTPLALHPRSRAVLWREFRKSAGLRIPTAQMLRIGPMRTVGPTVRVGGFKSQRPIGRFNIRFGKMKLPKTKGKSKKWF